MVFCREFCGKGLRKDLQGDLLKAVVKTFLFLLTLYLVPSAKGELDLLQCSADPNKSGSSVVGCFCMNMESVEALRKGNVECYHRKHKERRDFLARLERGARRVCEEVGACKEKRKQAEQCIENSHKNADQCRELINACDKAEEKTGNGICDACPKACSGERIPEAGPETEETRHDGKEKETPDLTGDYVREKCEEMSDEEKKKRCKDIADEIDKNEKAISSGKKKGDEGESSTSSLLNDLSSLGLIPTPEAQKLEKEKSEKKLASKLKEIKEKYEKGVPIPSSSGSVRGGKPLGRTSSLLDNILGSLKKPEAKVEKDEAEASVAGLKKKLHGTEDYIGVEGDNIFKAIRRAYQKKRKEVTFLEL